MTKRTIQIIDEGDKILVNPSDPITLENTFAAAVENRSLPQ
jgi:hypothetical protein